VVAVPILCSLVFRRSGHPALVSCFFGAGRCDLGSAFLPCFALSNFRQWDAAGAFTFWRRVAILRTP